MDKRLSLSLLCAIVLSLASCKKNDQDSQAKFDIRDCLSGSYDERCRAGGIIPSLTLSLEKILAESIIQDQQKIYGSPYRYRSRADTNLCLATVKDGSKTWIQWQKCSGVTEDARQQFHQVEQVQLKGAIYKDHELDLLAFKIATRSSIMASANSPDDSPILCMSPDSSSLKSSSLRREFYMKSWPASLQELSLVPCEDALWFMALPNQVGGNKAHDKHNKYMGIVALVSHSKALAQLFSEGGSKME